MAPGACAGPGAGAPAGVGLADCRRAVATARAERVDHELAVRSLRADELFSQGQRQPAAENALRPVLASLLALERGPAASEITCRGGVCKATFTVGAHAPPTSVFRPSWGERVEVAHYRARMDVDRGGTIVRIYTGTLILRHPSGEPRTRQQLRDEAAERLPVDENACRQDLASLRREDERLRAELRRFARPESETVRFERAPPNPVLVAEMGAFVLSTLGLTSQPADQVVECRGSICKLLIRTDQVQKLIDRDPDRISVGVVVFAGKETSVVLERLVPQAERSRRLVRAVREAIESGRSRCEGRSPGRGGLSVTVDIPATDPAHAAPRIAVSYEGSLVGTPLGQCVGDLVSERLRSPLDGAFAPYVATHDFLFASGRR
jgi:hypothetical protein